MRRYLACIAVTVSGCAITSSHHSGPNGRPVHFIDGMSASVAYAKANELCPGGYKILGEPKMVSVVDYTMTIECNQPQVRANSVPQPATIAQASKPREVGYNAYNVEHLPEVRACNDQPVANLIAKGSGFEKYTVSCINGDALSVRCETAVGCRVLR